MKKIMFSTKNKTSTIYVNTSMDKVFELCDRGRAVIITDKNVDRLYGDRFKGVKKIIIDDGEANKTLDTVHYIYEHLLASGCERNTVIIGIGGGMVCDIAGFVASTFLRGLSFGFVATTLLAQVDAAIGGKNGVNFKGYKNMIGTINQPDFVICDFSALKTLAHRELLNGMAELIKHAIIGDKRLFYEIEKEKEAFLNLDLSRIEPIVFKSMKVKIDIVKRDETERHERRKLNFGHTYGHAIESKFGLSHGEAVSIGMILETHLSISKGLLEKETLRRIKNLLTYFGLPTEMDGINRHILMDAIIKDKKKDGDGIYSILIKDIGDVVIEKVKMKEIEELLYDMRKP
ncbi:MAG TPA: 3-dehydroquinate synthase [Syntrophorhabdaceae bacterium]|nr:3-dehydroquinate synthase [Syntrophorhabdaceae bacterium]HPP42676.1 3-dehydroquinate synthase [Syntrophorhabdaceae bacterium]